MKKAIHTTIAICATCLVIGALSAISYCKAPEPKECTCRFKQQYHYSHTVTDQECILKDGALYVGSTVYMNVEWFKNECK